MSSRHRQLCWEAWVRAIGRSIHVTSSQPLGTRNAVTSLLVIIEGLVGKPGALLAEAKMRGVLFTVT